MAKRVIEVAALTHDAATRQNIPTAEFESVMREQDKTPIRLAYERRNRDLDPQLVWRGKDEQDWSDLDRPGAAALHPGEGAPEGHHRRPPARDAARERRRPRRRPTSSPTSTGCPARQARPSSTSTTSTGRTA